MVLVDEFKAYVSEAENIYDLIGNCFGLLCDNITNHQAFVSEYLGDEDESNCNPNIERLNRFSDTIMGLVHMYEPSKYHGIRDEILFNIEELQLEEYLDPKLNQLTIIYCVLAALDAEAMNWDVKRLAGIMGPLDRQQKTRYRVYFNLKKTLHTQYIENVGRERVHASTFYEHFNSFRFIDQNKWEGSIDVPQVKYLPLIPNKMREDADGCKLKIGVIPVSNSKNFEFAKTIGSGIKVDYSKCDQKKYVKGVLGALEKALDEECNIIVLPEYVVSPEIYTDVKKMIKEKGKERGVDKNPYLIFAGTIWTEDNNNIMKILDSWGEEIGEYYKYSPFTKMDRQTHKLEQYEALQNPGKKCDVFSVEEVGTFLPAICRDVIDGEYTEKLVKMLLPLFVVISAWSPSVASFEQRQKEFANKYFASSVLANACSSVDRTSNKIGNGGIVHKENTIAGLELKELCRNNCQGTCGDRECLFVLEYDFFYSDEENTKLDAYKLI